MGWVKVYDVWWQSLRLLSWMESVSSLAGHLVLEVSTAAQVSPIYAWTLQESANSLLYELGLSESGWLNTEPFRVIPLLPLADLKLCWREPSSSEVSTEQVTIPAKAPSVNFQVRGWEASKQRNEPREWALSSALLALLGLSHPKALLLPLAVFAIVVDFKGRSESCVWLILLWKCPWVVLAEIKRGIVFVAFGKSIS